MAKVLLLGCGNSRERRILFNGKSADFHDDELTTIDIDPNCGADILWDLTAIGEGRRLPFKDETFDELCSYDVLEHTGQQGDWRSYFREFTEYHRILKPNGYFGIIVPTGKDAFCDPGHSRFFSVNHFYFLCQRYYEENLANKTTCTDYRWFYKANFEVDHIEEVDNHHIAAILRKV